VLAVALGVALWGLWRAEKPVDRPLVRLDVDLGADVSFPAPSASASTVAISPDGTRLVYASGAPTELFTRRLDQPKATEISGTQGANTPFFSPDGQWIGFRSGSKLNKISVEGGAALPLVEISYFAGASWGEDGNVIVSEPLGRGLLRVPAGGGPPQIVAALGNGEVIFLVHRFCPEAKRSCLRLSLRIAWIDTRLRFSRWPIATGRSWPGAVHLPDIWQRLTGSAI
jgi:serine/threonine-protein kinase